MCDMIGLRHGTCVECDGALVVLRSSSTWCWLVMAMIRMQIVCGIGVVDEFQQRSNISLMRVAGGKGGTEQW